MLTASDGEEAIRLFDERASEIDLAMLDVVMPRLSGKAAADHIVDRRPEIPILFVSGYSSESIHTDFVLDERTQLIQKPYKRHDLLWRVRDILDGTHQPAGTRQAS